MSLVQDREALVRRIVERSTAPPTIGRSPLLAVPDVAGQQILRSAGNRAIGELLPRGGCPTAQRLLRPSDVLHLQREFGNGAVADLLPRRFPAAVQRVGEDEPIDDRATSWRGIDEQANARRLVQGKQDFLFDKTIKGPEAGVTPADRQANAASADRTKGRLADQSRRVRSENDVPWPPPPGFDVKYTENPDAAVRSFIDANRLAGTSNQIATIHARAKNKANIKGPESLLAPEAIEAHLGKFSNGAHAFIDPSASKKIEGEVEDPRFKGWGIDANFVAPLDEANALNAKAHKERGIETVEDELGIPNKYWSKSAWNPEKQLVRWIIPKPKLKIDPSDEEVVLEMAKGIETGADPALWVAGGLTKGGASEAVLKAIPRAQLMKMLAKGTIRKVTESYPETRNDIG
jgi:hypothetical protein